MNILLINQTFYPDVVSTAQHLTDLAEDLVAKGHTVSVLVGAHGYDDACQSYPHDEEYHQIKIHRISYSYFGKKNKWSRFLDFATFSLGLSVRLLFFSKQDLVIGLTSPPLVSAIGNLFCRLKGGSFAYWVMDMNPDEAIAAGWLKSDSVTGRLLRSISAWTFQKSHRIIALDPFMKRKIIKQYGIEENKITVIPPWAHDDHLWPIEHPVNAFRRSHHLEGKFVVMHSGNHSPCHPLTTLLNAALHYRNEPAVLFYFIGGGSRMTEVKEFKEAQGLQNIVQLPYQPLEKLSESLSAADLHVTVMGNEFVGIVHPCKIYNILSVGRPFIFLGPKESSQGRLVADKKIGFQVEHGDTEGMIKIIEAVRGFSREAQKDLAQRSVALKDSAFSRKEVSGRLVEVLENAFMPVKTGP